MIDLLQATTSEAADPISRWIDDVLIICTARIPDSDKRFRLAVAYEVPYINGRIAGLKERDAIRLAPERPV